MLGLITFGLLILVFSYYRRSGSPQNAGEDAERDVESGGNDGDSNKRVKIYEEKVLVIMADEERPTFVATPVTAGTSSLGDKNGSFYGGEGSEKADGGVKVKEEMESVVRDTERNHGNRPEERSWGFLSRCYRHHLGPRSLSIFCFKSLGISLLDLLEAGVWLCAYGYGFSFNFASYHGILRALSPGLCLV
ncbi:hypothetical protein V6N13_051762 [Hibiscus sabdariffa]